MNNPRKCIIGNKYNHLTTIEFAEMKNSRSFYKFVCDCGNEIIHSSKEVKKGAKKSCGTCEYKFGDISGQRFGRLTALAFNGIVNGKSTWLFGCDCGNEINTRANSVKTGNTKSCGCWEKEVLLARNIKHGLNRHPLHNIWFHIKRRCYNKNSSDFPDYGGRGIVVCDEWKNDFKSFYDWSIEKGYEEAKKKNTRISIDRIDVNGNYEPSNCKWSNDVEQARNRRSNVHITVDGVTKLQNEWAEEYNIPYQLIASRLKRGWKGRDLIKPPLKTWSRKRKTTP